MGILGNIFSRYNMDDVDKDLQKDFGLLEKFLAVYEDKTNSIKKAIQLWDEKKDTDKIEEIIRGIPEKNTQLQKLITDILRDEKMTSVIRSLIDSEIRKEGKPIIKVAMKAYLNGVNKNFSHITDNLKFLKKILLSQSLYLSRQKGFFAAKTVEDLKNKADFYLLLKNETDINRRIKQNVIYFMKATQGFIAVKSFRDNYLKSWKAEDMTNPSGINFERFYSDVYVPNFPDPEERDPRDWMEEYLYHNYQVNHIRNDRSHTHLLMAKIQERIVGGAIFEFIGCDEDVCFGIIWFIVVDQSERVKGFGRFLIESLVKILQKDAKTLGYSHLYGVFNEVNTVKKMTKEEIELDTRNSMDPEQREAFWENMRFPIMDFNYAQPPAVKGMKPVTYPNLRVLALDQAWLSEKSVPSTMLYKIMHKFFTDGIGMADPEREPTCKGILDEIRGKERVRIFM